MKRKKRVLSMALSMVMALSMILVMPVFSVESAAADTKDTISNIPIDLRDKDGKAIEQGNASIKFSKNSYKALGDELQIISECGTSKDDLGVASRFDIQQDADYGYLQAYMLYMSGVESDTFTNGSAIHASLTVPVPQGCTGVGARRLMSWVKSGDPTPEPNYSVVDATVNNDGTITIPIAFGVVRDPYYEDKNLFQAEGTYIIEFKEVVPVTGVELDKTTLDLTEGGTDTLKATVKPDGATVTTVSWMSADESIATVDQDGKVTAVKEGETTITAAADGDSTKSAECKVAVTKEKVPVSTVSITPTKATLVEKETLKLAATIAPKNATDTKVTWKSNNAAIAKVNKTTGLVTAVKEGTATITASVDGKKATCKITVKAPVKVTGVKLDQTKANVALGKKLTLTATVLPRKATNKNVTWKSNKPAVAKVDKNGVVTGVKKGTAVITVTTADGKKTASCTIKVTSSAKVKKITLNKTKLSVKKGKTATLKATVNPKDAVNNELVWTSSKKSVATVDENGKIKARKAGTCVITVATKDGTKKATCKVTVK